MDEMVERVARALVVVKIEDRNIKDLLEIMGYETDHWVDATVFARGLARCAIQAMREPTEAMRDAGWKAGVNAPDTFTAMIDAALSDLPPTHDL